MNADKKRDHFIFKYQSGEEIKKGDRVSFHREPAEVEFVADGPSDAEPGWFFQEFGGGVMIADPKVSGHTFIPASHLDECEDLEFVSRAGARPEG
jgi:hypothetical protein